MKRWVAVVGCTHGEFHTVYSKIASYEAQLQIKVDLVVMTGDLQTARDHNDLASLAVPNKYRKMGDFQDYYHGSKVPYLTVAIGGNHECSAYLMDLSLIHI